MSDMTVEKAQALLDGATPGPWYPQDFTAPEVNDSPTANDVTVSCTWPDHICVASMGGGYTGHRGLVQARADAQAIATWPDLARAYIAQAAELTRLRAQMEDWLSSQHYRYIGSDGKAVKARDLEDEVTRLRARCEAADQLAEAVRRRVDWTQLESALSAYEEAAK